MLIPFALHLLKLWKHNVQVAGVYASGATMFPCSGCFVQKENLTEINVTPQYRTQIKMTELLHEIGQVKARSKEHSIYQVKVMIFIIYLITELCSGIYM